MFNALRTAGSPGRADLRSELDVFVYSAERRMKMARSFNCGWNGNERTDSRGDGR